MKILNKSHFSLMLGLMLPTWFLSMWISNTAAAAMMIPIVSAVTSQVKSVTVPDGEFELFSFINV